MKSRTIALLSLIALLSVSCSTPARPARIDIEPSGIISELRYPVETVQDLAENVVILNAAYREELMNRLSLQIYIGRLAGEDVSDLEAQLIELRGASASR